MQLTGGQRPVHCPMFSVCSGLSHNRHHDHWHVSSRKPESKKILKGVHTCSGVASPGGQSAGACATAVSAQTYTAAVVAMAMADVNVRLLPILLGRISPPTPSVTKSTVSSPSCSGLVRGGLCRPLAGGRHCWAAGLLISRCQSASCWLSSPTRSLDEPVMVVATSGNVQRCWEALLALNAALTRCRAALWSVLVDCCRVEDPLESLRANSDVWPLANLQTGYRCSAASSCACAYGMASCPCRASATEGFQECSLNNSRCVNVAAGINTQQALLSPQLQLGNLRTEASTVPRWKFDLLLAS
jgi:hypothetical protein